MAIGKSIDPKDAEPKLTRWLQTKLPDADVTDVAVPPASGGSNETVFFTATFTENGAQQEQRLVARVLPSGDALFPTYDLENEFGILRALAENTPIPVPDVRWLELDDAVLGAPFMVMPFVGGGVLGDDPPFTAAGWFLDLDDKQRATLCDNGLEALAQIHSVDWQALGLEFLDRPEHGARGLEQQLRVWEHFYEWAADGTTYPVIEAAYTWLKDNRPESETLALSWGDARLGNLIFGEDQSVAAVLDWEMAALAAPELDLAWWLFLNHHHTDGIGVPRPAGMPTEEETLRRYEELTGRAVENLHYYKVFAGARMSSLMVRVAHLMKAGGLIPEDSPMGVNNPAAQMLAELLGLEKPADAATTFTGVFRDRV